MGYQSYLFLSRQPQSTGEKGGLFWLFLRMEVPSP